MNKRFFIFSAAILAVQMLGTNCDGCRQKIIDFKAAMAEA